MTAGDRIDCGRVRALLFAFLDSELDAQADIDLQLHLEHCCDCARQAEIERAIRQRLVATLGADLSPEPGERRDLVDPRQLLASLPAGRPEVHSARRVAGRKTAVIAAALLTVAAGLLAWITWSGRGGDSARPERVAFATVGLVDDFEHFLGEGRPLHIAAADADLVSQWMARELQLAVELPKMHGQCRLLGARRCESFASAAAFALYEIDGAPAALVVTKAPTQMQDGSQKEQLRGHTVLTCRRGDLAYAAVGRQYEDRLGELLPDRSDPVLPNQRSHR